MTATIRSATAGDADELVRLRWEFRLEAGTQAGRSRETFGEEMGGFLSSVFGDESAWRVWVADEHGRVVGCVWLQLVERVPHPNLARWERPIAYVTNMYVESDRRNSGLGRALLDVALTFARDRDVEGVVLWPSPRSAPFYERAGFRPAGGPLWLEIAGD
jgi:GNAT superfamily N-acetyltransferase